MKLLSVTLFILLHGYLAAQVHITGKVVDPQGTPLPYATVLLRDSADSSRMKNTVTDLEGAFAVEVPGPGKCVLTVRMVGYKTRTLSAQPDSGPDLKTIVLEEEAIALQAVTVTADKPLFEQRLDKLIVNVEKSTLAGGGSVLDVLENSPGIAVDRQSGSLGMNGKQGVQVMINGKIQRLPMNIVVQQLESMGASGIQRVELISTPSSRFDAEGDAGIINIVTKRPTDYGTNGTASVGLGYSDVSGYFKPQASLNVFHKREHLSLQANYAMNNDRRWQQWNYERMVYSKNLYSNTITDRYARWPVQRAGLGATWDISNRTSLNALVSGFSDLWRMESFNRSKVTVDNTDSVTIWLRDRETNHWKHLMGNINFSHQFSPGEKLNADIDYLYYHDHNPNTFSNVYLFHEDQRTREEEVRTGKETPINMLVMKLDYEKQLEAVKIEAGAKNTFSQVQNQLKLENRVNDAWVPDPRFTQDYRLRDDVKALYASVSGKLGRGQFQVGARAESTEMKVITASGEPIFDLDFWKLFPSAFYTIQVNERSAWQFSYGRRITRPAYTSVAPFVIFMDPFTYYWGNLRLKPTISDGLQVMYNDNDWLFSFKYNRDRNGIANNQSRYDRDEQKTYIFADNVDLIELYSLAAGIPFPITRWWNAQANALLTYQKTAHDYAGTPIRLRQHAARVSLSQTIKLPGKVTVELSALYASPTRVGLSLRKAWGSVSGGIQKVIGERSKLHLTATDIFWTRNSLYLTDNIVLGQRQQTSYYNEPRVLRLSYTLAFGNSKLKTGKQRTTASDTEQQRVNNQ